MPNHLESIPSLSRFQSAYRKLHSTATAQLRIHDDLSQAMNSQQVSALVLPDLSAAFDTIGNNILTNRLKPCFDTSKTGLKPAFLYSHPIFHLVHNLPLLVRNPLLNCHSFAAYHKDLN